MANNRIEWSGLTELYSALRAMPEELTERGAQIVIENAQEAGEEVRHHYESAAVTGNLASHLKVQVFEGDRVRFGVAAVVKSSAKHAHIYENGTQIRKNKAGKNLGAMPPAHVFVPTMIRKRRQMMTELKYMLVQKGFEVSGG